MPLFDTHAHYNDDAFDQDREELLDALPAAGVGAVVIPGVDAASSRSALALAETRPWLFAAAGIHPEEPYLTAGLADTGLLAQKHPGIPTIPGVFIRFYARAMPPPGRRRIPAEK